MILLVTITYKLYIQTIIILNISKISYLIIIIISNHMAKLHSNTLYMILVVWYKSIGH